MPIAISTWSIILAVKTVPSEIQSPKLAEIKSVYVAFHLQWPVSTKIYGPVQSFSD